MLAKPSNNIQVLALKKMCQGRIRIIDGEQVWNSVYLHYVIGFLYISTLLYISPMFVISPTFYIGVFGGWIVADVISFFVHIFIDSYWYEKHVARPRQPDDRYSLVNEHHSLTLNYSYMNGIELVAITYPAVLPFVLLTSTCHYILWRGLLLSTLYMGFVMSVTTFGMMTGYTHKWAHERNHKLLTNKCVMFLQDRGVLLDAATHSRHHQLANENKKGSFSLFSGFVDKFLNKK